MVDFILLTPTLSNRRGSLITLQPIVFVVFVVFKGYLDASPAGEGLA